MNYGADISITLSWCYRLEGAEILALWWKKLDSSTTNMNGTALIQWLPQFSPLTPHCSLNITPPHHPKFLQNAQIIYRSSNDHRQYKAIFHLPIRFCNTCYHWIDTIPHLIWHCKDFLYRSISYQIHTCFIQGHHTWDYIFLSKHRY